MLRLRLLLQFQTMTRNSTYWSKRCENSKATLKKIGTIMSKVRAILSSNFQNNPTVISF